MKRILKYGLSGADTTELPRGKILKIMLQNGWLHVWVEVAEHVRETMTITGYVTGAEHVRETMTITGYVTGAEPPNDAQHIETLCVDGYHIIHFYARGNVS